MVAPGAVHLPGWLDGDGQRRLTAACRRWADRSGGFRAPRMPRGGVMSVRMVCLGWHWYPYRYARTVDDGDGRPVEPFPTWLGELSRAAVTAAAAVEPRVVPVVPEPGTGTGTGTGWAYDPDVALVNWYDPGARMGMHADRDEASPAPVVSLSLGDSCIFRFGTAVGRGRPWTDVLLGSGDLFVFGGPSRLAYHGVPKVLAGTAEVALGPDGGRLNVTVRHSGLDGP